MGRGGAGGERRVSWVGEQKAMSGGRRSAEDYGILEI